MTNPGSGSASNAMDPQHWHYCIHSALGKPQNKFFFNGRAVGKGKGSANKEKRTVYLFFFFVKVPAANNVSKAVMALPLTKIFFGGFPTTIKKNIFCCFPYC